MQQTECYEESTRQIELFQVESRPVIVTATRTDISSNAGFLAFGKINRKLKLISAISSCFTDAEILRRKHASCPARFQHSLNDLLAQRVFQIGLGYEDGLDANDLRSDTALQLAVGKEQALGSQPMMSRLENLVSAKDLYRAWRRLVKLYCEEFHRDGAPVVLHIDSTNDPVHGQLGLFNGHYYEHCFHPLIVTEEASDFPLAIMMRDGKAASATRARSLLKRLIRWLREDIPGVSIVIKGDCSFGIADLINWFGQERIDYILGVGGNSRLEAMVKGLQDEVLATYESNKISHQRFVTVRYAAATWEREHSVVAKVEHTGLGMNTRFIVSSMMSEDPEKLYQSFQRRACRIEGCIEQLKNGLRFDKTACHKIRPNQMRYLEAALAWVLHLKIRELAQKILRELPTVQTLIQKFLKVAAIIRKTVRRYVVELSLVDPHSRLLMAILG